MKPGASDRDWQGQGNDWIGDEGKSKATLFPNNRRAKARSEAIRILGHSNTEVEVASLKRVVCQSVYDRLCPLVL